MRNTFSILGRVTEVARLGGLAGQAPVSQRVSSAAVYFPSVVLWSRGSQFFTAQEAQARRHRDELHLLITIARSE